MIKLINILKEITVFKPEKPIPIKYKDIYKDMKPVMAEFIHHYGVTGIDGDFPLIDELDSGDMMNNLAYYLAKYDGFTGTFGYLVSGIGDTNFYYNQLAFVFLVKYGLETGLLKLPFHDEYKWLDKTYNNGDIFNNPDLEKLYKYRGQF
jgi:hypothetical protein